MALLLVFEYWGNSATCAASAAELFTGFAAIKNVYGLLVDH
ncbi:hypothetical protein [Leucobacter ruminantium]|nr:hypothetical protein [Leucobacter ruminantium]